ncbi:MAG: cytochrome c, partial [Usitatibacteraceae bacterium]
MKPTTLHALLLLAALLPTAGASAADLAAGTAKTVCAACHGANGVSVADHIPNLAAQRASYLSSQLAALKAGTRKSEIMNVIAPQLSEADMANIAAHYASLPGATGDAKSAFLPNLAKTNVSFPANFKTGFTADTGFTLYHTINDAENKQV